MQKRASGFSLVELIAVLVIVGILALTLAGQFSAGSMVQLQASRDSLVAALFAAQQRAMAQVNDVRVRTVGTSVDVQQLNGGTWQSVRVGNVQYPLTLSSTVSIHTLTYNRLGQTQEVTIDLDQGESSASVRVSTSGFSQ